MRSHGHEYNRSCQFPAKKRAVGGAAVTGLFCSVFERYFFPESCKPTVGIKKAEYYSIQQRKFV